MNYKTEQEHFWAGEFGDQYIERNAGARLVSGNMALFSRALGRIPSPGSAIEFGANIGLNLRALEALFPSIELTAVEINPTAVGQLRAWGGVAEIREGSLLDFAADRQWDLAFVKGVLIHIAPIALPIAYDVIYRASRRWILIAEYYNPTPVEVVYRGYSGRLFKRDFAGEMLERHAGLRVVDYGFVWKRDPAFPLDDVTWFLLEKVGA